MAQTHFRAGQGIGIANASMLVLLELVNFDIANSVWSLMEADASLDDVLDELSAVGLRALGSFAIAHFEENSVRAVVRGEAVVGVRAQGADHSVESGMVRTWVERLIDEPEFVTVRLGGDSVMSSPFTLVAGVVPADTFVWSTEGVVDRFVFEDLSEFVPIEQPQSEAVTPTSTTSQLAGYEIEPGSETEHTLEPALDTVSEPDTVPESTSQSEPTPALDTDADVNLAVKTTQQSTLIPETVSDLDDVPVPVPLLEVDHVSVTQEPETPASESPERAPDPNHTMAVSFLDDSPSRPEAVVTPAPAQPVDEDGYDYDAMFGRTVARSVQSAAVHQEQPDAEQAFVSAGGSSSQATASAPLVGMAGPTGMPADVSVGMIKGIPQGIAASAFGGPESHGMPSGYATPGGPAGTQPGDHDGRTITKAQLDAMRAAQTAGTAPVQLPASASTMGGPTVQAIYCTNGHPNPPQGGQCRACGASVAGTPTVINRPRLGTLRFSDGSVTHLDHPVLVGRNPKLEGRMPNEMPTLLKLDVGQGLSRTHAAIRLEGWQVFVEDLGSSNGTLVTLPGRSARRLHDGEPTLLEFGALIDFGGEISCTFEKAS